jgi:hypothetical protein
MSVTSADVRKLSDEISVAFPPIDMPARSELILHDQGCAECIEFVRDLDEFRGKEISANVIRLIHQELSHLSPAGWRWMLPHYLRFCLSDQGREERMETEFLIYNLGPALKFQADTAKRLSLLTSAQIRCLVDFLQWCLTQSYWREFFGKEIDQAVNFLRTLRPT